jgi:hypothetical protein
MKEQINTNPLDSILGAGFGGLKTEKTETPESIKNIYESRFNWFNEEFISLDKQIPEEFKNEYNALYLMFGNSEHEKNIEDVILKHKVNVYDDVPMPEIVLSICDGYGNNRRMVMTRENISCITAQAKVGKTFLVKLVVSGILKKGVFQNRLHSELPDGRDKILYIDTEQSKFHVKLGLSQIKELLTPEYEHELNRMEVYQFDSVSTLKRLEFVKYLIYNRKPDFVILDGISDLALNTNDLAEADELVTNLRIWATENNCHICNVIHQNPNDVQTKMKGHLGTKLQDKSEIVIGVSIDKENDSVRIVQSLASRNRKPEPFQFSILETGTPEINNESVSEYKINGKKPLKTEKSNTELYRLLTTIYAKKSKDTVSFFRYGELLTAICLEFENAFKTPIGDSAGKKLIAKFVDKGWVLKSGQPKFTEYYLGEFAEETTFNYGNFHDTINENDTPF